MVISASYPYTLQNGTTADATQVMADFLQIQNDVNTFAAHNGANSDITSLTGLTTPLGTGFGGSGGSYVSQAALVTALLALAGGATIGGNINVSGAIVASGNITASNVTATSNLNCGGKVQENGNAIVPVGEVKMYAGSSAPSGFLLCNGAAVSRTTYAALFGVINTTYGPGDGSTTFNLPDLRGRVVAGVDYNVGGYADRLTTAGANINSRVLGVAGGEQTHQLTTAELASHAHGVSDSGHRHFEFNSVTANTNLPTLGDSDTPSWKNSNVNNPYSITKDAGADANIGLSSVATTGISVSAAGGDGAHQNTQPTIVLNYIIKT